MPHETAIIDTFAFQRLRRVSQLALTSYLYHGAEHSRFGHSLGVMHLAGEATRLILDKNEALIIELSGWTSEEFDERVDDTVRLARLAGLLHDIGHAPFSHAGEHDLFPGGRKHEAYSIAVINSPEMAHLIDDALSESIFTRDDLVKVLSGGMLPPYYGFVSQVISSAYDVDKMDYLLRDSHYCGVEYGTFDIPRLISTLTLDDEDPGGSLSLAVEEGGYHALEALVLARYFMFTQVYFHKVRRANDLILTEFIQELLTEQFGSGQYPGPDDLEEYLKWDDYGVFANAVSLSDSESDSLASMICHRRFPKVAYETLPHPDPMIARTAFRKLLSEVKERFPEVRIWADKASDHPERYQQQDIAIKVRNKSPRWKSFVKTSEVLRGLQPISQVRLFAYVGNDDGLLSEITEACRQIMA